MPPSVDAARDQRSERAALQPIIHPIPSSSAQIVPARASLFDYMEVFYNRQRRHSTINYVAPLAFEESTRA
jgi:hypothetical protein